MPTQDPALIRSMQQTQAVSCLLAFCEFAQRCTVLRNVVLPVAWRIQKRSADTVQRVPGAEPRVSRQPIYAEYKHANVVYVHQPHVLRGIQSDCVCLQCACTAASDSDNTPVVT
eukprot:1998635-Rhodomonas_salina.2